jgi:adenosylmethionine-8-amino-7-oxononanoate aminotransferase
LGQADNGHPLYSAAGLANLEIVEREQIDTVVAVLDEAIAVVEKQLGY